MTRIWFYTVEGIGFFPIDMLRYDRARPLEEKDSARIGDTMHPYKRQERPVQIELRGENPPTVGRWESFGWKVVDGSIRSEKR